MKRLSKRALGLISLALVLALTGSAVAFGGNTASAEETQTVVVTSPFTAAIAQVRGSVVGVNNYQTVRYSSNNYDPWGSFGWGFGYGYGYSRDTQPTTQEVLAGSGSGVVVAEHYVLTNYHVVEDATTLKINVMDDTGASQEYQAVLVAQDENLDIAIVYVPDLDLPAVPLGDSDTLQVGDWAICIGNPLSDTFYGTCTAGIVSALNRSVSSNTYDQYGRRTTSTTTMIQVDAAINNGNSGGGMFSVTGELMGVPARKYSGTVTGGADIDGIGMCIPINAAKPLLNDVLSGKIATPSVSSSNDSSASGQSSGGLEGRPRLGVTIRQINPASRYVASGLLPNGVLVSAVDADSPAEIAGMQPGDIIVDVDDTVITSMTQLTEIIQGHGEGDTLTIKVYRVPGLMDALNQGGEIGEDGEYVTLTVTLAYVDEIKQ